MTRADFSINFASWTFFDSDSVCKIWKFSLVPPRPLENDGTLCAFGRQKQVVCVLGDQTKSRATHSHLEGCPQAVV